jgi:hypothetical protein
MRGIARFLSKPWTVAALVFVLAAAGIILVALRVPDPEISPALAQREPPVVKLFIASTSMPTKRDRSSNSRTP